jgi:hypothetical protein
VLFFAPIVLALVLLTLFAQNVEVLAAAWRDPLSVLAARSPGQRDAGALYNIKHKRLALGHIDPTTIVPHERVLAATRMRPDPLLPADVTEGIPPALLPDEPVGNIQPGLLPTTSPVAPGPFSSLAPLGSTPLFSVGRFSEPTPTSNNTPGDNTPGGNPPGGNTPGVTPSVPEPATWLMNLAGLFAVGGMMRRGKRARPPAARTLVA